jgi:hypothetical protein
MGVHPFKESSLKDTTIPGDFTKNDASITMHWEGSKEGVALQKFDPLPRPSSSATAAPARPTGYLLVKGKAVHGT